MKLQEITRCYFGHEIQTFLEGTSQHTIAVYQLQTQHYHNRRAISQIGTTIASTERSMQHVPKNCGDRDEALGLILGSNSKIANKKNRTANKTTQH